MATTEVDTSEFEKGIARIIRDVEGQRNKVLDQMELVAEEILNRSINSPIPRDTGDLERSATTTRNEKKKEIVFGFNKIYAAFQDAPNQRSPHIIRPKRKRWLFVPLTQKARRIHRLGNDPSKEGLVFGGFVRRAGGNRVRSNISKYTKPADYILAKEVHIPIKGYGSELGPNHYFSETLKRNVDFALYSITRLVSRILDGEQQA